MAARAATAKKAKGKASSKGSFGYPWGTERPNAVIERLSEAQFAQAEEEIRQIQAETARRIRQIEMRVAVLDQVKRGVQQCCVMSPGGKFRFSRDLADAAGPMFDLSMAREVVDLDKRRPGRPSATANPEMQALRSIMRELVHEPAAQQRKRLASAAADPSNGDCKLPRRRISPVRSPVSSPTALPASLAPVSEIVVPLMSGVETAMASAEAGGEANPTGIDLAVAAQAALPEPEPVFEPEPEPEPEPEIDEAARRLLADSLTVVDRNGDRQEWTALVDREAEGASLFQPRSYVGRVMYFQAQTAERIESRSTRLDWNLLPEGLRQPALPELTSDPNTPVPALQAEFWGFGLPWTAPPEELAEPDVRKMLDVGRAFELGYYQPRTDQEWGRTVRMSGGVHRVAQRFEILMQDPRAVEVLRHEVWPLVLARRDILNGLAADVAAGKLTYAPLSDRERDRNHSLEYLMFKVADFDVLNSLNRTYWDMWALRMVDKLDWPEGLSRRELSEKFGAGQRIDYPPNLCVYDPAYPDWLVPYHYRAIENAGVLVHVDGEPIDVTGMLLSEQIIEPSLESFWDMVEKRLSATEIRGIDVV